MRSQKAFQVTAGLGALFAAVGVAVVAMPARAWAQAPALMPVQGFLTDAMGNPLPNGLVAVTFTLYDAPMAGLRCTSTRRT